MATKEEEVKAYALKNYPNIFNPKIVTRDGKGKIDKVYIKNIDPIVVDCDTHWCVSTSVTASPIILSKDI